MSTVLCDSQWGQIVIFEFVLWIVSTLTFAPVGATKKPAGPRRCAHEGITHVIYIFQCTHDGLLILSTPNNLIDELKRCDIRHNRFEQNGNVYVSVNVPHVGVWDDAKCPGGFVQAENVVLAVAKVADHVKFAQ